MISGVEETIEIMMGCILFTVRHSTDESCKRLHDGSTHLVRGVLGGGPH